MNILELDEAQGLTAEMVRQYMARTGWRPAESCTYECWIHDTLRPAAGAFVLREKIDGAWSVPTADDLALYVRDLAKLEGRTVQSILREINPRMRAAPSLPAWEAHGGMDGWWLVGVPERPTEKHFVRMLHMASGYRPLRVQAWGFSNEPDSLWRFWPCDANGNKSRWPEKDGVML